MTTFDEGPSALRRFIDEMRRRHVVRFAIWYSAAAFVVLQLAEIVFPAFGIGETGLRGLVIGVVLGFPPAMILAWIFDFTTEGIKRTEELPPDRRVSSLLPRLVLMGVTFLAVGGLALWLAGAISSDGGLLSEGSNRVAEERTGSEASPRIRSVAVLPLENLSADTSQNYFTAGLHEALISELSQVPALRVVSRTSVTQYANTTKSAPVIGQELGVDALIEGSVQKAGHEVRITVQLIRAANDSSVWSNSYDRKLEDVLNLQSAVAHEVVTKILGQINPEDESALRHASNRQIAPDAQDAYLRGKYEYDKGTPQGYRAALTHFQRAVQEDSTFAQAYAGLAGARFLLSMNRPARDTAALDRAQADAEHALALDSQSVEAREVLSYIRKGMLAMAPSSGPAPPNPPAKEEGATVRVLRVPGGGDSVVVNMGAFDTAWVGALTQLGQRIEERVRQATTESGRAGPPQWMPAAWQLMSTGRFDDAGKLLQGVVADSPGNPLAWEMFVRAEVSSRRTQAVVEAVRAWSASGAPGAPDAASVEKLRGDVAREGRRGYWRWNLQRLEAREAAGEDVSRADLAAAHAGLGDTDQALDLLSEAFERGERGLFTLQFDPVWDGLRDDARFTELAREAHSLRYSPTMRRHRPDG